MTAASSVVTISDRWGGSPVNLVGYGIKASREVSAHGSLSFFLPPRDALDLDVRNWKGKWIDWRHSSGFIWGGLLTATRPGSEAWEITAHSWEAMFVKRRTVPRGWPLVATPGGAFLWLINNADTDEPLPLGERFADEGGDPIRLDVRAMDLYGQAIPQLASAGAFEWTVDAETRDLSCGPRVGEDLTAQFRLCEGRHILPYSPLDDDLWTVTNDWYGVPTKRNPNSLPGIAAEDVDSIQAWGRLQDTVTINELDRRSMYGMLQRRLTTTREPLPTGTLTLVDVDGCFGWFDVGDTVRVTLDSAGIEAGFRVMSLGLDNDGGRMDVSGYVETIFAERVAA